MTESNKDHNIFSAGSGKQPSSTGLSYRQIFHPAFVLFCLYAVGEICYRWDGLTYHYAAFPEIIPTIAVVIIFYGILAVLSSILVWISQLVLGLIIEFIGWDGKVEKWLLFAGIFIFFGSLGWTVIEYIIYHSTTFNEKRTVFLLLSLGLVLITSALVLSHKGRRWIGIIQKPISPLSWLFGLTTALSLLLIAYHIL